MIWTLIFRVSGILVAGELIKRLLDESTRDIKPTRIYSVAEAARFLELTTVELHELIEKGEIGGKQVGQHVKVTGQSLLDYLQR